MGWKENPVSLLNRANILLAEKVNVFGGGLVRTTGEGRELAISGPSRGLETDWNAVGAVVLQNMKSWVGDRINLTPVTPGVA